MTMSEQQILCTRCGVTFTKFLRDMEQHNDEVVCPHCGQLSTPKPEPPQPSSPRRE
jgi:DNA-directed RNA polymerase subunit RPC12/RpoP